MRVGLLVVATGRYAEFVPSLMESARRWLLPGWEQRPLVFTDAGHILGAETRPWPHRKWPHGTLMRHHAYMGAAPHLLRQGLDFLIAMDADMRFVGPVGEEVVSDLTATLHPGFVGKRGSYEADPRSVAYVAPHEGTRYFCGGFLGGRPGRFLDLSRRIALGVDADRRKGLTAEWHDEAHLNRQLIDTPPTRALSPAYCTPEGCDWFTPAEPARVLALAKPHAQLRA